jgi:hypothetical protein
MDGVGTTPSTAPSNDPGWGEAVQQCIAFAPHIAVSVGICLLFWWMLSKHYAGLNAKMQAAWDVERESLKAQNKELLARLLGANGRRGR